MIEQAKANAGFKDVSVEDYLIRRRLADWRGNTLMLRQAAELLFARDVVEHPNAGVRVFLVVGTQRKVGREHNVEELPRIEGALPRVLAEAFDVVSSKLRHPAQLDDDARFQSVCEYPDFAWREAILNAVAHHDYGVQGRGVEVWLFDDRMEVTSPGGLMPTVSIDKLLAGERTHISRNPRIVRCLVDLKLMRDSGEGILRMAEKMEQRGLPDPAFKVGEHEIWVTLRNREMLAADGAGADTDRGELAPDRVDLEPDRVELAPDRVELEPDRVELALTDTEQQLIAALGARPRKEKLWITILVLLKRRPWSARELAVALGNRNPRRISKHLVQMTEAGIVKRTVPGKITNPNQAYYAAEGYYGPDIDTVTQP